MACFFGMETVVAPSGDPSGYCWEIVAFRRADYSLANYGQTDLKSLSGMFLYLKILFFINKGETDTAKNTRGSDIYSMTFRFIAFSSIIV